MDHSNGGGSRCGRILGPTESMADLTGREVGGYRLVSLLGRGGMGEVYRAHDPRLGRDVAIKVLPSSVATVPERMARFEREARLLAALNHPHIGAIYGIAETDGLRGLVLELVEGPTLRERIALGLTPPEALRIASSDRRRAGPGARERHRSSRSQARQRQDRIGRRGQSARLRHRQDVGERGGRGPASDDHHDAEHAPRQPPRDGRIHEPRAGAREARG